MGIFLHVNVCDLEMIRFKFHGQSLSSKGLNSVFPIVQRSSGSTTFRTFPSMSRLYIKQSLTLISTLSLCDFIESVPVTYLIAQFLYVQAQT